MATFVTIDLDDIACYHAIHGIEAEAPKGVVMRKCLPRFLELLAEFDAHGTIFVIGRVLDEELTAEAAGEDNGVQHLRAAIEAGHELANHSYAHAYDMVDWEAQAIAEDLRRCDRLLRDLGARPVGFRAPGYTHDTKMLAQVAALGYRYDSSRLPAPLYYAAKRGVMAWMGLKGKRSISYKGGASSFTGTSAPHYLPELGLWEVPMSVSRGPRIPLIGTFMLGGPKRIAEFLLTEAAIRRDLVLELHGLDFAIPKQDGLHPDLVAAEPVLKTPWEERRKRLWRLIKAREGSGTIKGGLPRTGLGGGGV